MSSEKQETGQSFGPADTELFTLRLWKVMPANATERRGRLQLIRTGEVRYFRDWGSLIACLEEMLLYHGGRSR